MFERGNTFFQVYLTETKSVKVRAESYKGGEPQKYGWWCIPGASVFEAAEMYNPYRDFMLCGKIKGAFPRGRSLFS